ncbi:UvrD-helicase domain-containing protein [uncultured Paludibaculum sp.]|uniref:UvrD-helicase domain-containing protein n=1 Tax=uncultured Paludibaculum sp. TaxID=1765020 RepID=UPI002AABC13B|nr:UvrD-helicase domain-containing protein [uncultured Paludibaculum sp.]
MALSQAQLDAVKRSGQDACCVAGPGSGKTTVLVERFAWLVEQGMDPGRILAITFTEKAATQIKARLVKRFTGDTERRRGVERAQVSTIHAFCMGLLQEHAIRAGLDPQFSVLDERESDTEQAAAMETVLDRLAAERREEFVAVAEAWSANDMALALRGVYEDLRMGGGARTALQRLPEFRPEVEIEELRRSVRQMLDDSPSPTTDAQRRRVENGRAWLSQEPSLQWLADFTIDKRGLKAGHPVYDGLDRVKMLRDQARRCLVGAAHLKERAVLRDALVEFEQEYQRRKRARASLDFEDLQEHTLRLLESDSEIREETRERFDSILMDELQDTNPVQWRILDQMRRPGRFFAVGDINQSIYGFRHAVPEQFAAYQETVRAAGGIVDRLQSNYRSRPEVLAAVTASLVTTPSVGVTRHELIGERAYPPGAAPFVEVQRMEEGEADNEALWIAHRLRELHGDLMVGDPPRPAKFRDMAVLARSKAPFDALESAFERFGIPCQIDRGKNFYEEQEILDLTNWLRVLENPANEIPLFALLRSPFFGLSDESLLLARANGGLAPEEAWQRIARARVLREEIASDCILARLMDETGYQDGLSRRGRANVDKFLRLLRDLEAAAPGDLAGHLAQIDDLRDRGKEPNAPEVEFSDAVQVMSIHSAKGLEFPVVVVAAMQKGTPNFSEPLAWTPQTGLGLRWRLPDGKTTEPDPALAACISLTSERERAEADRLLYVAMTRAEERLILSWTQPGRGVPPWVLQIETGLQIEWPSDVNVAAETDTVRLIRHSGQPEEMEPPMLEGALAEAVEVAPQAESNQPSATLAVTSLAVFADCPRRYFLQFLAGWPQPIAAGDTGGGAALGTEVHELLSGVKTEASPEAAALAEVFLQSDLAQRVQQANRVEREFDFLVELDGVLLRGQVDLWFEHNGRVVIVDYKTDRVLDEARLATYALQLGFYAHALRQMLGRPVDEAWLFSLRDGTAHAVTLGTWEERLADLRALSEAEISGQFPLREAPRCQWCPYLGGACPSTFDSSLA